MMRKRNCRLEVCFTRDELAELTRKARKARLSKAGFIRCAIHGTQVRDAPPADLPILIQEVRRAGVQMEQVLRRIELQGVLDVSQLRQALEENRAVEQLIVNTYTTKTR